MKHIVITGSTRGIGYGLAEAFLQLGCAVTVSGRSRESTDGAVRKLAAQHDPDRLLGAAVGLFKGTLAAAVLVTVLTLFLPGGSQILGRSLLAPYLQKAGSHLVRLAPAAVEGLYKQKQERQAGEQHEAQSTKTMKQ